MYDHQGEAMRTNYQSGMRGKRIVVGSGLAQNEDDQTKAMLAQAISRTIKVRGWTQEQAANVLAIDQPKVSALVRGRTAGYSTGRLIRFLNQLDQDVTIMVRPRSGTSRLARTLVLSENDS